MGMAIENKRDRKHQATTKRKNENAPIAVEAANHQGESTSGPGPSSHVYIPAEPYVASPLDFKQSFTKFPLTLRFDDSLRQFEHGLRALAVVEGICSEFTASSGVEKVRLITGEEYLRAGKGGALLAYAMLCEHLPALRQLSNEERIKVAKCFSKRFILLYRIHMTSKMFPDPNCPYAIILPGGIIDRTRLDELFVDITDLEQREMVRVSVIERHFEFGRKYFQPLQISQMEFCALTGILLWKCVAHNLSASIPVEVIATNREALYTELFAMITEQFGGSTVPEVPIRFANLLEMLHQLTLHTIHVDEMYTMAKIFSNFTDFWDAIILPS